MTVFRCLAPGVLLVAMAAVAPGQIVPPNTLGLYTVADTAPGQNHIYEGSPGAVTLYAVLTNPWNPRLDAAMTAVGGYAFRIALPAGLFLLGAELPGAFAVFDADDPQADCPLVAASGSCNDPVFAFWPAGGGCPPVQAVSWSAAAARFR